MVAVASTVRSPSIAAIEHLVTSPKTNINLQDLESGSTVLHKCLYNGHLTVALFILRSRPDVDLSIKDKEGLTCLDLLNMTMPLPRLFDDELEHAGRSWASRRATLSGSPSRNRFSEPGVQVIGNNNNTNNNNSITGNNSGDSIDRDNDSDSDTDLKLGAQDNSSTQPGSNGMQRSAMSVWTWGTNSNFVLGTPNADTRASPERIDLLWTLHASSKQKDAQISVDSLAEYDIQIRQVVMSKLHTCILTQCGRLFVHGFGPGGRLGLGHEETTIRPTEVFGNFEGISFVAVGPDHTVCIASDGSVWTWGSNEYAQLGFTVDATSSGPPRQTRPGQVSLKKVVCVGAAASKLHTVVFTNNGALYTWGTNSGQLGYQQAVQHTPRKVTSFPQQQILQVAATNTATAILVGTNEVFVISDERCAKIQFPLPSIPQAIAARLGASYSQPRPSRIRKIVAGTQQFGALMATGDVFMWTTATGMGSSASASAGASILAEIGKGTAAGSRDAWMQVMFPQRRPRLVWSVRKRHFAARDVAFGIDSTVMIGTDSGHVFIGSRRQQTLPASQSQQIAGNARDATIYVSPRVAAASSSSLASTPFTSASLTSSPSGGAPTQAVIPPSFSLSSSLTSSFNSSTGIDATKDASFYFKYTKVPNLRHIVSVAASSGGAFMALRSDCRPNPFALEPSSLAMDLRYALHQPPSRYHLHILSSPDHDIYAKAHHGTKHGDDYEPARQRNSASQVLESNHEQKQDTEQFHMSLYPHGSLFDVKFVCEGGFTIYAHRSILSSRSPLFQQHFSKTASGASDTRPTTQSRSSSKPTPAMQSKSQLSESIRIAQDPNAEGLYVIDMPLIHHSSLECILDFIYMGRFTKMWDNTVLFAQSAATIDSASAAASTASARATAGISKKSKDKQIQQTQQNHSTNSGAVDASAPLPLTVRVYQEFTRLARYFKLNETDILNATLKAVGTSNSNSIIDPRYPNTKSNPFVSQSDPPAVLISTSDKLRASFSQLLMTLNSGSQHKNNNHTNPENQSDSLTDVVVALAEGEMVEAHRVMLAARCPFFDAIIGAFSPWQLPQTETCHGKRVPLVRLEHINRHVFDHINRHVFDVILAWIYMDPEWNDAPRSQSLHTLTNQTDTLGLFPLLSMTRESTTELIAFVIDVLATANELLLDALKNLCGYILSSLIDIKNVVGLLQIAELYNVKGLKSSCLGFICWNLESFIESRALEDIDSGLLLDIEKQLQALQRQKFPTLRGPGGYYEMLRERAVAAEQEAKRQRRAMYDQRKREADANANANTSASASAFSTSLTSPTLAAIDPLSSSRGHVDGASEISSSYSAESVSARSSLQSPTLKTMRSSSLDPESVHPNHMLEVSRLARSLETKGNYTFERVLSKDSTARKRISDAVTVSPLYSASQTAPTIEDDNVFKLEMDDSAYTPSSQTPTKPPPSSSSSSSMPLQHFSKSGADASKTASPFGDQGAAFTPTPIKLSKSHPPMHLNTSVASTPSTSKAPFDTIRSPLSNIVSPQMMPTTLGTAWSPATKAVDSK
eukprot:jgi/Hompol1/2517/HPOL_000072-RA